MINMGKGAATNRKDDGFENVFGLHRGGIRRNRGVLQFLDVAPFIETDVVDCARSDLAGTLCLVVDVG